MSFNTGIDEIKKLVISIDPARYASSRNFKKGAVSKLGPYISRGTLSTKKNLSSHQNQQEFSGTKRRSTYKNWPGEITGNRYGRVNNNLSFLT